jgi:small multidrug resistance pump
MSNLYAFFVAALLALLLTVSHILLKITSTSSSNSAIDMYIDNAGKILIALVIYFGVFLIYPYVLRFFPISVIFPIYTGLTMLLVMISGSAFFGEKIQLIQYIGAVLLVSGIALITYPSPIEP